jgi:hypothetical protein
VPFLKLARWIDSGKFALAALKAIPSRGLIIGGGLKPEGEEVQFRPDSSGGAEDLAETGELLANQELL